MLEEFYDIFLLMGHANALELSRKAHITAGSISIPDIEFNNPWLDIGAKSSGHILGALIQLRNSPLTLPQQTEALEALQSYLIARQLQDDLYDWKDDLKNGQLTFAVYTILKDANIEAGNYSLTGLLPKLESVFWRKSLVKLTTMVQKHTTISRRFFEHNLPVKHESDMISLIERLESVTEQAIHANKDQKMFLESFKRQGTE